MNIFEAIRQDHDRQRMLLDRLVATSGESEKRKSIYGQLKKELQIHSDAEERHFYIPLIKDDMTQEHARHGVAEHHEIDELIQTLEETEMSSSAWLVYARQLRDTVYHHLEDEEHTIFQLAGKVLSDDQKQQLATQYNQHMSNNR